MSRVAPERLYRVDANPKIAADDEAASTAPGTKLAVAVAVAKMSRPRNKRKNRRAMLRVAGACALWLGLTLFGAAKIILSHGSSSDAQLWTHVTGALAVIGIAAGVAIIVLPQLLRLMAAVHMSDLELSEWDERRRKVARQWVQVALITFVMGAMEIDDRVIVSIFVVAVMLIVACNIVIAVVGAGGGWTAGVLLAVAFALAAIAGLLYMRATYREIEEMEAHAAEYDKADADVLGDRVRDPAALGPPVRRPPSQLRQSSELGGIEAILARAAELEGAMAERVVAPLATAPTGGAPPNEKLGPSPKGLKRSAEKVRLDYGGDAHQLKDPLRCSIVCATFDALCLCWERLLELERECVLEILQVKNRFLTGAHGYKDININIRFEALICEARARARRGGG